VAFTVSEHLVDVPLVKAKLATKTLPWGAPSKQGGIPKAQSLFTPWLQGTMKPNPSRRFATLDLS